MLRQPAAALGKGLGVRQHLGDPIQGAVAQQCMTDRQHQCPTDAELTVHPESIQRGGDSALH